MKKIIEFFKNRIVISIIGLIVLSLLIWFVGPQIKFGANNAAPLGGMVARLITIMVIIVLWGLNNLRIAMHDKKTNDSLVNDLQESQAGAASQVSEQSSEEMHVISERFNQALATLKRIKFKGARSSRALYELPWYIIIGPPGSGKTTALINSSLEFPLAEKFGKEALRGVGGTRNCDWWFTNEAVLIDTAGRYTTQDSHKVIDSASWDGFLGLLKKYRRRRPVNGAIVAISLQELLTQTEEERNNHARVIRARIDELMSKLEIRFPIYLMFTKTDLVSGFSEYFEDMDKDSREQVWGVSLPNAPHASQNPDLEYFQDQYNNLIRRLYAGVISRMHHERDVNRRAAIEAFPQQMENLKDVIMQFVNHAFIKNRYQFQPYLRGIYFTSGTQDGTPIDRLMSSVSANFGFSRQAMNSGMGMGKSFFLGRLFREVIFPESELVGSNRKYESFIKWSQRAAYLGLASVTGILISIWAASFTRNQMYMHEVQGYVADYNAEQKHISDWSTDLKSVLPSLNALAKASRVYNQDAHPWLSGLGMYDGVVDSAADKAYSLKLQTLFLPRLLRYMEYSLKGGQGDGALYDDFRVYMMFQKTEHLDSDSIRNWFDSHWSAHDAGAQQTHHDLMRHLNALLGQGLKPAKLDTQLVASIRGKLSRIPLAQRIYNRLRTNPDYTAKVNLVNDFGESVRAAYLIDPAVQHNLTLPVMFTLRAYKSIDLSAKSPVIDRLARDNWVMSDTADSGSTLSDAELDKLSDQVKEYYTNEYRSRWQNVYASLQIKPFDNLRQADDTLHNFIDPVYSPLLSILKVGATNTTLTNQRLNDMADDNKNGAKGKALGMLASNVKLTSVDKQFRELNRLSRESKDRPAEIQNLVQKLRQLQEFVNGIVIAPDPGKKAFEIAKARFQNGSGDVMSSLNNYSDSLPEPLNRWMHSLANETWKVVLRSAHGYLNTAWHEQVYNSCHNALAGRYPLNRSSDDEAAMLDFTEFFKPGGTIDKFTNQYVKPFVDVNGNWSARGIAHYSIGFSSSTLAQLKRAVLIRDVFFRQNPQMPSLSFQLRPYLMQKTDEKFTLELGSKRIVYSHGPKFWSTLNWTGNEDSSRVRLIFEDLHGKQYSTSYEGPWAWFRLQDHARISRTAGSGIYLATLGIPDGLQHEDAYENDPNKHVISFEIKPKSIYNPFNRELLGAFRCTDGI